MVSVSLLILSIVDLYWNVPRRSDEEETHPPYHVDSHCVDCDSAFDSSSFSHQYQYQYHSSSCYDDSLDDSLDDLNYFPYPVRDRASSSPP